MDKNRQIDIMGIVNLTDDSFYAPSRCLAADSNVGHAARMAACRTETLLKEGATIIDVGACSTRPGSLPVGEDEEWRRLKPALSAIRSISPDINISIDTYWASVVERAYDLIGDFIVNDISAGEDDARMLPLVGGLGLTYIAMHKRGTSVTMQQLTDYNLITENLLEYFSEFAENTDRYGIKKWILDPGFGFAKTIPQNYTLLRELSSFRTFADSLTPSPRLLVGISRKSMIYKRLDISPEDSLPATQVLHLAALQNGADILRVHDAGEAVRTVSLYRDLA